MMIFSMSYFLSLLFVDLLVIHLTSVIVTCILFFSSHLMTVCMFVAGFMLVYLVNQ